MKKVVIISKSNFNKRFWKINIIKTGNIGKGIISSLLSGPSRLAQVIGLSVGMYSVCLLHSGPAAASQPALEETKQAQSPR